MIYTLSNLSSLEKTFHKYLCLYSTLILLVIASLAYVNQYQKEQSQELEQIKKELSEKKALNHKIFHAIEKRSGYAELQQLAISKQTIDINQAIKNLTTKYPDVTLLNLTIKEASSISPLNKQFKLETVSMDLESNDPKTLGAFLQALEKNSKSLVYIDAVSIDLHKISYILKSKILFINFRQGPS